MTEVQYFYRWLTKYRKDRPTVVCLHGFTGTSKTFSGLFPDNNWNFLAIDLIGHGQTSVYVHPKYYRMNSVVDHLKNLMVKLQISEYFVLGYSMGGRTALAWAINDARVKGLILESARPGIADEKKRRERQLKDNQLAGRILAGPLETFVNSWEKIPLFKSQQYLTEPVKHCVRKERLSQKRYGLAMSLMMMGTGQQENYWDRLPQDIPILLITGQLDLKFQKIADKMKEKSSRMKWSVLPGGHCVHLEEPTLFTRTVTKWLLKP